MRKKAVIAVVIPAFDEERAIARVLDAAPSWVDAVVADNGSTDGTAAIARQHGATVVVEPERGYDRPIRRTLANEGAAAGAFRLAIAADGLVYRLIERLTNCRARRLELPYGDQALFLRRETFTALGGFPLLPILENFEFARRLRRVVASVWWKSTP